MASPSPASARTIALPSNAPTPVLSGPVTAALSDSTIAPSTRSPDPKAARRGPVAAVLHAALHTPPAFYAINMGTGITSILLHRYPYQGHWLQYLGIAVFVLNVIIFAVLTVSNVLRYTVYHGLFRTVAKHNVASMFWGCMPMGLSTIVNMVCFVCVEAWGENWAYAALGLWWVNVVLAVLVNFGMIFVLFTRQCQTPASLAPTWLLPIVGTVVVAASGAVVAQHLAPFNAGLARSTILCSFVIWGTGVPPALMVITLWIYRAALQGPPAPAALASVFLPLGPCGQGAFGIVSMGVGVRTLAYTYGVPVIPGLTEAEGAQRIADAMYAGCMLTGLVLWGLALLWYTIAVALFVDQWRKDWRLLGPGKFSVGLWALTFPIGVFATSTIVLAAELRSPALKVIAAFLSAQVILHFLYVGSMTLWAWINGALYNAPEIAGKDVYTRSDWSRRVSHDLEAACEAEAAAAAAPAAARKA
ncbi:Plasma membrane sulfite pump involved in sulfite metabolism [Vanrija albida]|uniref:Plasma membrane sulfite pump involved in sulfite metabolism n=1 Tax=Vanrija albida TaxID=181172 RepID=A0ABR3PZZ2_9TREE